MSSRKFNPAFRFRRSGKVTRKRIYSRKPKRTHKKQRGRCKIANKAIEMLSPVPLAFTESASRYLVKKALSKLTWKKPVSNTSNTVITVKPTANRYDGD